MEKHTTVVYVVNVVVKKVKKDLVSPIGKGQVIRKNHVVTFAGSTVCTLHK
jgi:hypothetical protein